MFRIRKPSDKYRTINNPPVQNARKSLNELLGLETFAPTAQQEQNIVSGTKTVYAKGPRIARNIKALSEDNY